MVKDYRKLIANGKIFLATTECAQFDRAKDLFVFVDTVLDKELNFRIGKLVQCDIRKLVFFPEVLRDEIVERKIVHKAPIPIFYEKALDWVCNVYKYITNELGLPTAFGIGIIHYTGIKKTVKKEDGSIVDKLVFTCYSFAPEFHTEIGDDFLLFLDELKRFIRLIESSNQASANEAIETREFDLKRWEFLDKYLSGLYDASSNDIPPCRLFDVRVEDKSTREEVVLKDDFQKKINIFLIEYVMSYCEANKNSIDNITYTPKSYLILYATKDNHTKIKLSPSQMALYCYIQSFKNYGISKKHLIEDINSHRGKYRKLSALFGTIHNDYDTAKLNVVVCQINKKIKTSLAQAKREQGSFDFTQWTEKLLIKTNEKHNYYIGVSERRFKPVIVDDNRRFVESPDDYIDKL